MITILHNVLDRIYRHAEKDFPNECCGFLGAHNTDRIMCESIPCRNAQDRLHREDPAAHPRTARQAFYIDDEDLFAVHQRAAEREYDLVGVYHSHINVDAFVSDEDRRCALVNGVPVWPECRHLILSVREGVVAHIKCFYWDPGKKDFVERKIQIM